MRTFVFAGIRKTLLFLTLAATCVLLGAPALGEQAYRIHGGDQLGVQVFGDQTLTQTVTVLPNGDIFYPLVGRLHVGNQTPDEAAGTIRSALKKYVRNPIVTVSVIAQGQLNVLVLGNVKNPGKYLVPPSSRLSDAIAAAGGVGPTDGNFPDARIADAAGSVRSISLQKLLHDGDTSVDLPISSGSTVYVPAPITFVVEVLGSVDHPGDVLLREGDRVAMAIAKAGTSADRNPDLNHIKVRRTMPDGQTASFDINLFKELDAANVSQQFVMEKGDVVFVPQGKKGIGAKLVGAGGILYLLRNLTLVGL